MTPDEARQYLHTMINAHDDTLRALRLAKTDTLTTIRALEEAFQAAGRAAHAVGDTFAAQDAAIEAALTANRAALQYLNALE